MYVADMVRQEVGRRFAAEQVGEVLGVLESTTLPFLDLPGHERERDRVHLAILLVADGDLAQLREATALAAIDWRDVLMWAGLGGGNWPEVLRRAGFPVP
jgi:hypothetical protein